MKKIISILLALVLVMSFAVTAFASETGATTTTGTITVTKNYKDQTYKLYKLFDATTVDGRTDGGEGISYRLMEGKNDFKAGELDGATWFKLDEAGNVTLADGVTDIEFSEDFRAWAEAYGKKTGDNLTAGSDNDESIKWENLTEGYYFITTTTGSLVTVDSIKPDVSVEDKNTAPEVDKTITSANSVDEDGKKALAQVGTTVSYKAEITVGKGATKYVFHDSMDDGLTYNNDAAVTGVASGASTYTVNKVGTDTFTITFADEYIKSLKVGDKITITYSATVNSDAITTDPLSNTCHVSYGDNNTSTPASEADVFEAKITITKKDGKEDPLAGAGFVLQNAGEKYYKIENKVVSWVDSIDEATEFTSDENGAVPAFTGLANGSYIIVEKTVPAGYNKAADQQVVINEHNYEASNLEKTAEVINQTGAELPSTGGIGTTLFYVIGGLLVVGATVVLVTKKRMEQ